MDNTNVGGNRGNYAGEPVDFDELFRAGSQEWGNDQKDEMIAEEETGIPTKAMGETAVFSSLDYDPQFANEPVRTEAFPTRNSSEVVGANESGFEHAKELEPLIKDGSTEGRIGKLAVSLSGDVMDEASTREVQKKIAEYKNDPFELQNYRDKAMVESLRDNYGRIFADDGNESIEATDLANTANTTGADSGMSDMGITDITGGSIGA